MSYRHLVVADRYAQGQASYRAGHHLRDLFPIMEEIERLHEQADLTNQQHDEIAAGAHSLLIGFADSLIDDIRHAARRNSPPRA
jgi:hypothetical protein